jgi:toluene monooxygenase system protein E
MTARELRAARAQKPARRTYACLEDLRRKPTDYEITSTALLYYPERGFEVETPTLQHYAAQRATRLRSKDWDALQDPAQFTYSTYVAERRDQEAFLDRLLERPATPLSPELRPLLGLLSALRFPLHGLQLLAAYVGAFAPSGRISIVAAFQAADELRRIQRLCQWLSRSGLPAAEIDRQGRSLWQEDARFQPLRRLVEELLVERDWARTLVALNASLKPIFDRLWFGHIARVAERHHDEVLEKILESLGEDGRWHENWFVALARVARESDPGNAGVMSEWVTSLRPRVAQAGQSLLQACGTLLGDERERERVWLGLDSALNTHLDKAGVGREDEPGGAA